jgi:hypothetical protein
MPSTARRFALLLLLLATLPVSGATFLDYNGPDAGVLVYSAGGIELPSIVTFHFRRVALPDGKKVSDWKGAIGCRCIGLVKPKDFDSDYTGRETGRVIARNLPPGRYEIFNYLISGYNGIGTVSTRSKEAFSIPFEIKAGEATYIGNFARAHVPSRKGPLPYFVITDKSERDLPIARAKRPDLTTIRNEVFDVTSIGNPALRTTEFETFADVVKRIREGND